MTGPRMAPPPPALGAIDTSPEGVQLVGSLARHLRQVVMHRTLSPAQQVQALLLVAANIASDVPDAQMREALDFFVVDAAVRWHCAVASRRDLANLPPAGSA